MKITEITDLFGKGSDIGKMYNPGVDPEIQAADLARRGQTVTARPTTGAEDQQAWDQQYATHFNPDGTPRNTGGSSTGRGTVRYISDFSTRTRNKPIRPELMQVLQAASAETGLTVEIFSGGQDVRGRGDRRLGSTRHDAGYAADIYVYDSEGNRLSTRGDDPRVVNFVAALRRAGARGLGAHPGYMGGTGIHVDVVGTSQGGGSMWGAGGVGSPPRSIAQAFSTGRGTGTA